MTPPNQRGDRLSLLAPILWRINVSPRAEASLVQG
jgi:hypothetical protein